MDYSLLVGVHFREVSASQETEGYSLTQMSFIGFLVTSVYPDTSSFFFLHL